MINSVSTMDRVLGSVYLDAVSQNLNFNTSLFYKKIEKSSANVCGKELVAPCRFGINGGVAAVAETGDLPTASYTDFLNLKAPLVNIYGNIEFSDKLIRVAEKGATTTIDVINNELENLLRSAKFNLRRMLFQNGTGTMAKVHSATSTGLNIPVDTVRNLVKGMIIDVVDSNDAVIMSGRRIVSVDDTTNKIKVDSSVDVNLAQGDIICLKGSYNNELFGIPYLFDDNLTTLYGSSRSVISYAKPIKHAAASLTGPVMQNCIDLIEAKGANEPNIILCDFATRRAYLTYLTNLGLNLNYEYVEGGFKAPLFSGIPVVAETFVAPRTAYFLNTEDYVLGQLNDWSWIIGSNGGILQPIAGKAAYSATLVKYCNLICRRPTTQLQLTYTA